MLDLTFPRRHLAIPGLRHLISFTTNRIFYHLLLHLQSCPPYQNNPHFESCLSDHTHTLTWWQRHYLTGTWTDLRNVADMEFNFELGRPFRPFEQLMGVLPLASKDHIPAAYQVRFSFSFASTSPGFRIATSALVETGSVYGPCCHR